MADFDQFERLYKKALGQESDNISSIADEISKLPEQNKVKVVKGKSSHEISVFLQKGRIALRSYFSHDSKFETSANNRVGSDLIEVRTKVPIELKSGSQKTDGNSGIEIVSWALGDDDKSELSKIMSDPMKVRQKLYSAGNFQGILDSKKATMESLYEYFCARVEEDQLAPPRLKHFVICMTKGLTKSEEIKSTFSGGSVKAPLLLEANWDDGLRRYENCFLPEEEIEVDSIDLTESRAQLVCQGRSSQIKVRIYPNFKNSYKHGRTRIPADNWVANACFHVWVET